MLSVVLTVSLIYVPSAIGSTGSIYYFDGLLCEFLNIHPQEIHAIYFGCKMIPENKATILSYLSGDLANVETYDCIKSEQEYKLMFRKMTR